jgi:2-dehydropantoate 2-reductase
MRSIRGAAMSHQAVPRRRVGIVGAGAMGSLFAYMLSAPCDVALLECNDEIVTAIAARGVVLDDLPALPVAVTRDPAALYNVDVLFVFVKAGESLTALRPFAGQLNPSMPIVSLQNGLGNEAAIKAAVGANLPLVLGATTEGALLEAPGRVRRLAIGTTVLGSGGASRETSQWVAKLLLDAGLAASVVYDIRPHLWGKLVANAAINPVAALLGEQSGVILRDADAGALARALTVESAAVAQALKIKLPFPDPWAYVCAVVKATAELPNSMALDLRHGRRTEIDYINGAIVATGRRFSVLTPYNDAVVRLVKARERAASERHLEPLLS